MCLRVVYWLFSLLFDRKNAADSCAACRDVDIHEPVIWSHIFFKESLTEPNPGAHQGE